MKKFVSELKNILTDAARQMGIRRPTSVWRNIVSAFRPKGEAAQYRRWRKKFERHSQRVSNEYQTLVNNGALPTISLIISADAGSSAGLQECLDSVTAQAYPHWRLYVVSTDPEGGLCLNEHTKRDPRITVVSQNSKVSMAQAINTTLELVEDEYISLLDPDDLLAPQTLLRAAERLMAQPGLSLLYSDEDQIDAEGNRFDPHFKPDWNPDLLLGHNYIGSLTLFSAELLRSVGGFRDAAQGTLEYDLLLRCMPHLDSINVAHIPDVLIHRRAGKAPASVPGEVRTNAASLRAIADYLAANHSGAKVVNGLAPDSYRVIWPLPEPLPKVSLLIPTRDGIELLKPCVDAILDKTDYPNLEVLILDNQSSCERTLAYFDELTADRRVSVHRWDHPFNYSAINNFGASVSTGDIIGLVNNDIEPINGDWLREMVRQVVRPDIGCVGAKLYYPDGRIQHAGVILGVGGIAAHSHRFFPSDSHGYFSRLTLVQNLSAVTAACLLVRKSVFNEVGGLDEEHLAVAFNDVDLCLKVREAGFRNLWTPYAELYHHESASRGPENTRAKRERFAREVKTMQERWGHALIRDPAYNINLTRQREDFSLEV